MNYNDLTVTSLEWSLVTGIIPKQLISAIFTAVNYCDSYYIYTIYICIDMYIVYIYIYMYTYF